MKTIDHAAPCPNTTCAAYGVIPKHPADNVVIKYGHSHTGRQRYRCTLCGHTFTETVGTVFYRRRTRPDEIVSALSQIAEGSRLSSVARTTGHKIDTISAWVKAAGEQAEPLEQWLLRDYQIAQAQLDGLWCFVRHKGEKNGFEETEEHGQFFRSTILDVATRLRVTRGIGKTETDASIEAFETLKHRGHPSAPPPLVSDGWGGIREALVEAYGTVPAYRGHGRPPTRKRPHPGWKYLQVIKRGCKKGGRQQFPDGLKKSSTRSFSICLFVNMAPL